MRVCHIVDRLDVRGGSDWFLRGLIAGLDRHCEQWLIAGSVSGGAPGCPVTIDASLTLADGTGAWDRLGDGADIVHLHNVQNPALLAWAETRPSLLTVQDHRAFCPGRGKWTADRNPCGDSMDRDTCSGCFDDDDYFEHIYALTARRRDAASRMQVTVLSDYMRRELIAAGFRRSAVAVTPPWPSDLDFDCEPEPGPPCVLFAGRLAEAKGVRHALEAWRQTARAWPLVFAGTGPLRQELEAAHCDVRGWLPRAELSRLYARAAVVVVPSLWQEPFGIVGIEALAFAIPVVAYASGGIPEWHPGPGLVSRGDIDALADQLASPPAVSRLDARVATVNGVKRMLSVYRDRAGSTSTTTRTS